ncbi:hypothetical protein CVV26_02500 [Candidatus Kuenenbacteria bacterium HGW-Kuenenbacteria-1]|uniref:NADH:ubiquinone oxidoreductase 30kDa subunit domain-containing protein n=1 Tax=Candidatus Kuenenbacteria bacterium HGW-Kuenenbacteria-1 TaxID=2013812 RepID=A0A2N1UN57_9BACT|nr:MAG: hypothetical protein CVV26_02500 [Candidatus Kuenenbacteria bacterium HGW-Kuenenbacteria-1]
MIEEKIIKKYISNDLKFVVEGNTVVFNVSILDIANICQKLYFEHQMQLKTITATDERHENNCFKIFYVFGLPRENIFFIPYIILKDTKEFPSITKSIHEASGYERKIKTFFGLNPVGHPHLRPILLHENWPAEKFPLRKDFNWQERPAEVDGLYEFQKVKGEGIYEIPVGPVHAGIN